MSKCILPLSSLLQERFAFQTGASVRTFAVDVRRQQDRPFLRLQWENRDGAPLGPEFTLEVEGPALVEAFLPGGAIQAEPVLPNPTIRQRPPKGASFLAVETDGWLSRLDVSELSVDRRGLGSPDTRSFPDSSRPVLYPVFSDGFTDVEHFRGKVIELLNWLTERRPFSEAGVRERFGLSAHYWAAPSAGISHFGADLTGPLDCSPSPASPVFMGNREAAAALLSKWMWKGRGLILMNSAKRGGAGGEAAWKFPAWASTAECHGESWQSIAAHEIGHGMGLADEYVLKIDPAHPHKYDKWRNQPFPRGPNVIDEADPAQTPWRDLTNVGLLAGRPTVSEAEQLDWRDPLPGGRPTIGTFAGAFYRESGMRPSMNCLMRDLNAGQFCEVCVRHLRAQLA